MNMFMYILLGIVAYLIGIPVTYVVVSRRMKWEASDKVLNDVDSIDLDWSSTDRAGFSALSWLGLLISGVVILGCVLIIKGRRFFKWIDKVFNIGDF